MEKGVTIVVPVYNRQGLVTRALDSIYAQSWRPLRLLVVDNASTDESARVVSDWIGAHREEGFSAELLHEPVAGAPAARNRGLAHVATEYVMFFDSDDEMRSDCVEKAMKGVEGVDLAYWHEEMVELDGTRRSKPFWKGDKMMRQIYNALLTTQVFICRTDYIRERGGWNNDARVWNDWELGIRLLQKNPRTRHIPEVLVTWYSQKESLTGTGFLEKRGAWENSIDIAERNLKEERDARRQLERLDYVRAVLAAHYRREGDAAAADELLAKAMSRPGRGRLRNGLLKFLHHYTAKGGRAAYYAWELFLKV